jgi:hypothetical protein
VKIDPSPVCIRAGEGVKPKLNNWQDKIDVLKAAAGLRRADSLITIDEEVVVDPENANVGRKGFYIGKEGFPTVDGVTAGIVVDD